MCRQSWPRAGRLILLKVRGQRKLTCKITHSIQIFNMIHTFWLVCSRLSSLLLLLELSGLVGGREVKLRLIFVTQCSRGKRRLRRRPCSTERTLGRCTSCRTKRWEQQQADTVIWIVFRPDWQTWKIQSQDGLWEFWFVYSHPLSRAACDQFCLQLHVQ